MDIQLPQGKYLNGLDRINVVLGRNGAGKSRMLRLLDQYCRGDQERFGLVKYVTPERGGEWQFDPSVESNLRSSPNWAADRRHANRYDQYRQTTMAEFSALELGYFRRIEARSRAGENVPIDFNSVLAKINSLLENIEIMRPDEGAAAQQSYPVRLKAGGAATPSTGFMSSGESELVALGCDIVTFSHRAATEGHTKKTNILIIDEPDVHLHPDLQRG